MIPQAPLLVVWIVTLLRSMFSEGLDFGYLPWATMNVHYLYKPTPDWGVYNVLCSVTWKMSETYSPPKCPSRLAIFSLVAPQKMKEPIPSQIIEMVGNCLMELETTRIRFHILGWFDNDVSKKPDQPILCVSVHKDKAAEHSKNTMIEWEPGCGDYCEHSYDYTEFYLVVSLKPKANKLWALHALLKRLFYDEHNEPCILDVVQEYNECLDRAKWKQVERLMKMLITPAEKHATVIGSGVQLRARLEEELPDADF